MVCLPEAGIDVDFGAESRFNGLLYMPNWFALRTRNQRAFRAVRTLIVAIVAAIELDSVWMLCSWCAPNTTWPGAMGGTHLICGDSELIVGPQCALRRNRRKTCPRRSVGLRRTGSVY